MQYAMLNEATGNTDTPRLAKWQSILVRSVEAAVLRCAAEILVITEQHHQGYPAGA